MFYLMTGDKISRRKSGYIIHYGIFVRFPNGECWVAENNIGSGVRWVTYEQFLDGKELFSFEAFKGSEQQRQRVIPFINSKIGTGYELWRYNCEHFANEVQTGVRRSTQVKVFAGAIAVGVLLNVVIAATDE